MEMGRIHRNVTILAADETVGTYKKYIPGDFGGFVRENFKSSALQTGPTLMSRKCENYIRPLSGNNKEFPL